MWRKKNVINEEFIDLIGSSFINSVVENGYNDYPISVECAMQKSKLKISFWNRCELFCIQCI